MSTKHTVMAEDYIGYEAMVMLAASSGGEGHPRKRLNAVVRIRMDEPVKAFFLVTLGNVANEQKSSFTTFGEAAEYYNSL